MALKRVLITLVQKAIRKKVCIDYLHKGKYTANLVFTTILTIDQSGKLSFCEVRIR